MIVHLSHRTEDLVAALAEVVASPRGEGEDGPLRAETIAVQGRGMERWLSMELSRRLGVWANPSFPFPRRLIEQAFDAVLGSADAAAASRFEPESMTWSIASLLPALLAREAFVDLRRFLAAAGLSEHASRVRRIQLASRIAQTLDHYVIYRPDMIAAWEVDPAPRDWQAILWRELILRAGRHHLAARAADFQSALASGAELRAGFPSRVCLFGITTLPPLYLDVLSALGRRVELHLFLLRCAREPLADSPRDNPLWASLGEVGRQFHRLLASHDRHGIEQRCCASPDALQQPTLLQALQRAVRGDDAPPPRLDDRSVEVHACHGPMREVEVLHDQLRDLFEADPTLEPRDVVVMTPDVERYAPFIEARFDTSGDGAAIEYRVADRRVGATHRVVDALWALLDVVAGRFTASAVVDLLMVDAIRARFRIDEQDLEELIGWIDSAGIRWGVNAGHRAAVGQPALAQNTWQQGIDRLLLSLAMPAGSQKLFCGALPASGVEPGRVLLLGRFVEFCEALFAFREAVAGAHRLDTWHELLSRGLAQLIDAAEDGAQQQARVRDALRDLAERARESGFEEPVLLESVREELERHLERNAEAHHFLTGGVTFCELVPMRSIPFRVVAMLGMDDAAFPRSRVPLGFDLVAQDPRPGDRTSRDDDRYLFLEALVSARDHLIVTYSGRSLRDGTRRAPSVVVDELIDEALRLASPQAPDAARAALVIEHPLHGFSPRYFDGSAPGLFSYASVDRAGAEALLEARAARRDAAAGRAWVGAALAGRADLARAEAATEVVEVADLARFFEHPVRAFLQRRFGLYLQDEIEALEDREPLDLDALQRWVLGDALLRNQLAGLTPDEAAEIVRADGRLPPGAIGDVKREQSQRRVRELLERLESVRAGAALAPVAVDRQLGRWDLRGEVGDLWAGGRVVHQLSALPHPREINFWIHHLVLNWTAPASTPRDSFLVARKGDGTEVLHLPPSDDPEPILLDLVELFALGERLPLPLLRRTSLAYAKQYESRPSAAPSKSVRNRWEGRQGGGGPPERDDPYLAQAFRDVDPLDPSAPLPGPGFAELARRVYQPYLQSVESCE